jgi:plastocyanin
LKKGLLALVVVLALPAQAAAQGGTQEVSTGDDFFNPENVSVEVGSASIHWAWGPPASLNEHNVRQDDRLFYSGALVTSGEFTVTPSAGSFHYYCELHGFDGGGMDGALKVKPTGTVSGRKATVVWATPETDSGTRFDVRQKVGSKKPKVVEEKTKALEGTFKLKSGKNQFQVRSRQGKAVSDWSPKLKLKS